MDKIEGLQNDAKPNLKNLQPWGCMSYIHNTSHIYGKLDPRANKNIFIKYFDYSMGYVMYNEHPDGGMTKIESHNVDFIENVFPNIDEVKRVLNSMSCKKKNIPIFKRW